MATTGCSNGRLNDPRAYFFTDVIKRKEGTPANDWKAVLESLPPQGMGVNPKPGEVQPANAPFYGITVMIDSGGNARGRIWLPTNTPEVNGYFTHEIQVIADGPTPGSFVWAWQDIGGAPYSPHACDSVEPVPPGTTDPDPPVVPPSDLEARVVALEQALADLSAVAVRNGERASLSGPDETHYLVARDGDANVDEANPKSPDILFRLWRRGETSEA